MSVGEIVLLVVAGLQLLSAIVLGWIQVALSRKMAKLTLDVDVWTKGRSAIEDRRHFDAVRIESAIFLAEFRDELDLLPLANMGFLYDPHRPYSRPIYNAYGLLSEDARKHVTRKNGLLEIESTVFGEDLFQVVGGALEDSYRGRFPADFSNGPPHFFYQTAKYVRRAIESGAEMVPLSEGTTLWRYDDRLTDVLRDARDGLISAPGRAMWGGLLPTGGKLDADFGDCVFAARYAFWFGSSVEFDEDEYGESIFSYGGPSSYLTGQASEVRMEDVFLWAIFEIYTKLVLPRVKNVEITA